MGVKLAAILIMAFVVVPISGSATEPLRNAAAEALLGAALPPLMHQPRGKQIGRPRRCAATASLRTSPSPR